MRLRGLIPGAVPTASLVGDETFLCQVTQHLLNEERAPLGLPVHRLRQAPACLLALQRVDHPVDLVDGEAAQRHSEQLTRPAQLCHRGRQGMGPVHLDIAIAPHDEEPRPAEVAREVDEVVQGASVRPVQVLQHQQNGLDRGGISQKTGDGLEQPPAVVLGIAGWAQLHLHPVAHLGDDARHISGAASQLVPQSIRLAVEYVGAERLHKRKIG